MTTPKNTSRLLWTLLWISVAACVLVITASFEFASRSLANVNQHLAVQGFLSDEIGHCTLCRGSCRRGIAHCYADSDKSVAVVYVYYAVQGNYSDNLKYFITNGVGYSTEVDFSILLRGPAPADMIDTRENVFVFRDDLNQGYDVGGWVQGLRLLQQKTERLYHYFIFMNSSVRGPFLPFYTSSSKLQWITYLIRPLDDTTKLSGISINCPDGVGRKIPHLQSMVWATDYDTLLGLVNANLWQVPKTKFDTLKFEGDLSFFVLQQGYNIHTLQRKYTNWDFRALLTQTNPCQNIDLDVFYKNGWYSDMTPHPYEYIFMKTNRGVAEKSLTAYTSWPQKDLDMRLVAFSHNLNLEGASLYLFDLITHLKDDYKIRVVSPQDGPLKRLYESFNVETLVCTNALACLDPSSKVVLFNTVLFGIVIETLEKRENIDFKIIWLLHEHDIHNYQRFMSPIYNATSNVRLVFCSYSLSKIYPMHEKHFYIVQGWVRDGNTYYRRNDIEARKKLKVLKEKNYFLISLIGTVCQRKRQLEFLRSFREYLQDVHRVDVKVIIIGTSSDDPMLDDVSTFVRAFLRDNVLIMTGVLQVTTLFRYIDLHWSNSVSEAFPLNILEAAYHGVPVVSTDIAAVREMLPRGSYAHYKLDSDIKNVLRHTLNHYDKLKEYSKIGTKYVVSKHSSHNGLQKWKAVLFDVQDSSADVCIIVRTYHAHRSHKFYNLTSLLLSIKNLEYEKWHVWVVNTDAEEFGDLSKIVYDIGDIRINLLDLKAPKFTAADPGYRVTDKAIKYCKKGTRWLLITNGNNYYYPSFLNNLDPNYDIIASDFYSRYTHEYDGDIYGSGCANFLDGAKFGSCKRNLLRLYHTDLGANILNLHKFQCQKMSFSEMMVQDSSQDSQMIEVLVYFGWKVKHIYECLFSHNPNAFSCSINHGVWDLVSSSCIHKDDVQLQNKVRVCGDLDVISSQ